MDSPYEISRGPDELHYTYLDTFGRPVIVAHKENLVEQHIQDIVVGAHAAPESGRGTRARRAPCNPTEGGRVISWLQSPSAVILEPRKIKSDAVSPSISHEVMGPDAMIFVF